MSTPKWTPGDWQLRGQYIHAGDQWIATANGDPSNPEVQANAAVLVVATKLYAAIESLLEDLAYTTGWSNANDCYCGGFFGDDDTPCVHRQAHQLLAKARGESPPS